MNPDALTPREREVLAKLRTGAINREIALEFGISQRTVETHRSRIMEKFGAKNVVDLMRITAESSARLTAAAPQMLAELKRLFAKHGYQETADVIAKAEDLAS